MPMRDHGPTTRPFRAIRLSAGLLIRLVLLSGVATAADRASGHTQVQMRHVALRVDKSIVFLIDNLRGELFGSIPAKLPTFDDKSSISIRIERATIAVSPANLADLINNYVLAYKDSPISNVQLTISRDKLILNANIGGKVPVPMTLEGSVSATPDGLVKFTTSSIKMGELPVKSLMEIFGISAQRILHLSENRGMKMVGNDIVINLNQIALAPRIYGSVVEVRIEGNQIVERFDVPDKSKPRSNLAPPIERASYMYYRGGILAFGKMTMRDADLELVNKENKDWLKFSFDQYNEQLVAGYSRSTSSFGLISFVPDYDQMPIANKKGRPQ
jgi:hypothetical protein